MHTFKIHAPLNPNAAYVEMDGRRLDGVTSVAFTIKVREMTTVSLTVMGEVEVEGEFRESEIVRVERQDEHTGMLRARVKRAFKTEFPLADDVEVECFTGLVMSGLEGDAP